MPHALSRTPVEQTLPEQQPAQFAGPQSGVWQEPPWQTFAWPAQFAHWTPPVPHAVSCAPPAQTSLPMQQPPGQFAGPQFAGGMHAPALQLSLAPQTLHASPPAPHAARVVATTQALPTQQPGQFAGPQRATAWQVRSFGWPCATHWRPVAVQFVHA